MPEFAVKTLSGGTTSLSQNDFDALAGGLSGSLMGPDIPGVR